MNVFIYDLAEGDIPERPALDPDKFVVEDNVGEAIHVHYRATRIEYSIEDFLRLAEACEDASEVLTDGNRSVRQVVSRVPDLRGIPLPPRNC